MREKRRKDHEQLATDTQSLFEDQAGPPFQSLCFHQSPGQAKGAHARSSVHRFRSLKRFHALAAVSDSVAQRLLDSGVSAKKIRTIANALDVQKFEREHPF